MGFEQVALSSSYVARDSKIVDAVLQYPPLHIVPLHKKTDISLPKLECRISFALNCCCLRPKAKDLVITRVVVVLGFFV